VTLGIYIKELFMDNGGAFERIKQVGSKGREFWYARDLQQVLGYQDSNAFEAELAAAAEQCTASGVDSKQHFIIVKRKLENGPAEVRDIILSRFAAYLAVNDNAIAGKLVEPKSKVACRTAAGFEIPQPAFDPKRVLEFARAYFARMSPEQELTPEAFNELEARKRIMLRSGVVNANKKLVRIAHEEKFTEYANLYDEGYRGLYEMSAAEIQYKMGILARQNIHDFMCSAGLAANLSKTEIAVEEMGKTNLSRYGQSKANQIHNEAGQLVRRSIINAGGTKPEFMPVAEKSIKQIERMYK